MLFEKYSASGNDFLITHWKYLEKEINRSSLAVLLCNRFEGIGADGLVILDSHLEYPYVWDFYNSDGSKASMCGNASRCVGLYAYLHSLASKSHCFLSGAGEIGVEILSENYPYKVKSHLGKYKKIDKIQEWSLFDTGVPHLVKLASKEEFEKITLEEMRALRETYDANINIAYQDGESYKIKTYERGVEGITLACGTGMASLVALLDRGLDQIQRYQIIPPIGEVLNFEIMKQKISFGGEVRKIAQCQINLENFGVKA